MDTLKILIPYPTGHDTTSIRTILFNNLIPILKKRVNVRILRVVYQPEKIDKIPAETSDITTFDLRNYKNALEILKLRGAAHQKKIVAMQITGDGIVVYPEQEVFSDIE